VLERIEADGSEGENCHQVLIEDLARHLSRGPQTAEAPPAEMVPAELEAEPAAVTVGAEAAVRVDVAVMDKLMDLVGELVLTRGQIGELALEDEDGPLAAPYRQLLLVTDELREGVMRARLQSVGTVTGKLRRIARDLATALGKRVQVEVEGEDIGVDRAVNEALRDPLLHLVRNALDHAIETPEERLACGKPAVGRVRIRAFHEGGRVFVELSDDGRGVDPDKLVERALASGLLTRDEAALLTSRGALELMFRAGLTTKAEVTNVSGRGVGMDVVRAKLAQVGGSIDVSSERGRGTVFRINVPLTLAIMPVLVASCGGQRYALPQVHVQEVVRLGADEILTAVDDVGDARILRLRGGLVPLVDLAGQLGLGSSAGDGSLMVVVLESNGGRFGLVVDAVGNSVEAVVKPLPRGTRSIPLYAGVTILVDGLPALILDPAAFAAAVGLSAREEEDEADGPALADLGPTTDLLLARLAGGTHAAVPLDRVLRLERFSAGSVRRSGSRRVVRYREGTLPLVDVASRLLGATIAPPRDDLTGGHIQVIVVESAAGAVGLVVEDIDDVVTHSAPPARRPPGSLSDLIVVGDRVIELIDVDLLVGASALDQPA
jgi:two-component system chemotaxis sensor kinase CheA